MATFSQLARNMRKHAGSVEAGVHKIVRKTALLVDQVVVLSTPVDTGRARSNWLPSLGAAREGATIPPYNPLPEGTNPAKFGEQANAQSAINAARLTVAGRTTSEQDIYFTNNVEYIEQLNNGNSTQAPAGFVQMAVEAAAAAVRQDPTRILKENL